MPRTERSPFRLSLALTDFTACDLFEPSSSTHQRQLASWLSKAPRVGHGATQIPAAAIYHAISDVTGAGAPPSAQQVSQLHKIGTLLSATARSASSILAAATGTAALAPAEEANAVSNLRLSFFFLAHLIKTTGTWKDARGAAFKPSTTAWQLRSAGFSALVATQTACGEARAAALLVLHGALDIVGHPLPAHDADAKSAAEICRLSVCDYLAATMSPQDGRSESGAAAAAGALLSLLEQPKQSEGVVKEVHRVVCALMSRHALAGCSLIGMAVRRAGAEGAGTDALAALLASLASVSSTEGASIRAALVAHAPEVIALLTHPRPAVRKAALDIAGALAGGGVSQSRWSRLHFAACVRGLDDEDATLRAKALGALEASASRAGATLWTAPSEGQTPEVMGITPDFFASSLGARLTDRSVTVRKKAALAVAALAVAALAVAALAAADPSPVPFVAAALQRHVIPVIAKLLQLPHDSKLYPGDAGAALSDALTALASAASQDAAGVLQLLELWHNSQDESARSNFGAAIAKACLVPPTDRQPGLLLDEVLKLCRKHDVCLLRQILHQDTGFAARVQAALDSTAERAADTDVEGLLPLCRAIYILVDSSPSEEQLEWLLGVARSIAVSSAVARPDGAEALHWCLHAAGMCHLSSEQAPSIALLVRELALQPGVASEEVYTAVALLQQLPSPKDAMCALLRDLAQVAGIIACHPLAPAPAEEVRGVAATSFLGVLSALSSSCLDEKQRFLDNLRGESAIAGAEEGDGGYLAEESDAKAQEAAAQKFLDDLLASEDCVPAVFITTALELAASPLAGPLDRAEALQLLGSLAQLSQPLAELCLPTVSPLLDIAAHGSSLVCLAAIHFTKAVVAAFPATCSHLLSRFAPLLETRGTDDQQPSLPCFVPQTAAAVLAALLTSGRLRAHDWMGLVALGVVHPDANVVSVMQNSLVQMLEAAGSGAERAALVLAVAHQAPLGAREAAANAAVGLLKSTDHQSDDVVSPCLMAALAAGAAGRGDTEQARVAAALLRPLRPSLKMLRLLATGLESTATGYLPHSLSQGLQDFVRRAVVAAPAAAEEQGQRKRGREGKASATALQAQLLETLAARAASRPRRTHR